MQAPNIPSHKQAPVLQTIKHFIATHKAAVVTAPAHWGCVIAGGAFHYFFLPLPAQQGLGTSSTGAGFKKNAL
jgi:hypothetical protein